MQKSANQHPKARLQNIAHRAMLERGLLPEFSKEELAELHAIEQIHAKAKGSVRDLRKLAWCSIDNDDSRDLDQLTLAEAMPKGAVKIHVAIADVDALVPKGSSIDGHARHNTTSVYTAAAIFPMLPEELSTDQTSLNQGVDRLAVVIEMVVAPDGSLQGVEVFRALVRNHAKLAYNEVAAWLEGRRPLPEEISAIAGLSENLRLQDQAAQKLKGLRHKNGALDFETIQVRPVFEGEDLKDLQPERKNRAREIIEDFMIAANGVTARYLAEKQFPSLRRIVREPKRWPRIVELASENGFTLPKAPDSAALEKFLAAAKAEDPVRFPDLSLSVIKLMGAGEYALELPGDEATGHFGLAVQDYGHSTAPNRRYPDLITQRLLKAALAGQPSPYANQELEELAKHCTEGEDKARKVERQVEKSAAAMLLESRIGEEFEALVTGASEKGVWVRLLNPPIEGKLKGSPQGIDVGRRLRVRLVSTNVERGFIDFERV